MFMLRLSFADPFYRRGTEDERCIGPDSDGIRIEGRACTVFELMPHRTTRALSPQGSSCWNGASPWEGYRQVAPS